MQQEFDNVKKLQDKCPSIVKAHGLVEDRLDPFIIYDKMESDLSQYERLEKDLNAEELLNIAIEISQGLKCMHNHNYIHLDIKPGNIFLDKNGKAIIGDLGGILNMANINNNPKLTFSPEFADLSIFLGTKNLGPAFDVFSLGATLFTLINKYPVYESAPGLETARNYPLIFNQHVKDHSLLEDGFEKKLKESLLKMLDPDPSKRPSMNEVLNTFNDLKQTSHNLQKPISATRRKSSSSDYLPTEENSEDSDSYSDSYSPPPPGGNHSTQEGSF